MAHARFSWQTSESESRGATPNGDMHGGRRPSAGSERQGVDYYSHMAMPIELQQPAHGHAQRRPTEPSIPQSPQSPDAAQPHWRSDPVRQSAVPEKSGYARQEPQQPHPATYVPPGDHRSIDTRAVSYPYPNSAPPPVSPGPISKKTFPDHPGDFSAQTEPRPYIAADQSYVPHSPTTATLSNRHATFSPDAAHGPNGPAHNPGQITHPNMNLTAPGEKQGWKHSLCECNTDVSTCLFGLFCPCMLYGKTAYRLTQKREKKDATDLLGWHKFNGRCGLMTAACGLWCIFPIIHRTRLRHLYNLSGSLSEDIAEGCCCCCCAIIQNDREVRDREDNKRRWAGPATSEVYTAPGQMVYAPPSG